MRARACVCVKRAIPTGRRFWRQRSVSDVEETEEHELDGQTY